MKKISFLLLWLLLSCSAKTSLEDFNENGWKDDKYGCESNRVTEVASLMNQRQKILGLSEQEIIALLGAPDETNLYQRSQKFLVYYTSPGPKCDHHGENASRLEIRISALNTVNEMIHYP